MTDQSSSLVVFLIAIPVFILTIALEWWFARHRHEERLYDVADTMTNLHLGSGQLLIGAVTKAPLLVLYHWVYTQSTSWGVPSWDTQQWWVWLLGFLVMDCAYYWFHRFSHEVNFLWAAHAVHHQSEYYNLSVALRQSWIQQLYSGVFYIPLALLGIPTAMFFMLNAMNTLSQYWIHTRLIDRIGPLEAVLNTPSHHRVHHGTDDPYVDKNYAGALIIWDKMFGTFTAETTTPRFGVIKPLRSWNPAWANLDVWGLMWRRMRHGGMTFAQSLSLPFRAPAWQAEGESPLAIKLRTESDYELFSARHEQLMIYASVLGVIDISLGSVLIAFAPSMSSLNVALSVGAIIGSAVIHNALLEGRPWSISAEWLRIGLLALGLAYAYAQGLALSWIGGGAALLALRY